MPKKAKNTKLNKLKTKNAPKKSAIKTKTVLKNKTTKSVSNKNLNKNKNTKLIKKTPKASIKK